MSIGLAYGDVLSFRSTFQSEKEQKYKTAYEERTKNLKDKMNMNRTKTDERDTQNRHICVKTVYSLTLTYREKSKFVLKRNLSFEASVASETPIQEVHEIVRSHYGVKHTNTFLASYPNES